MLERLEWGIGDGWFMVDSSDFPNLERVSRESARALLTGLDEFIMFAESSALHRIESSGFTAEIHDGALRLNGTWSAVNLPLEDDNFGWVQYPAEVEATEFPFESLRGEPRKPVTGKLKGSSDAAILERKDEYCTLVTWDDEELVLHRIDGDLSWNHGESNPGGTVWRARFR